VNSLIRGLAILTTLLPGYCFAQANPPPSTAVTLRDFILVTLASSPYGTDPVFASAWCFYVDVDHTYNWWMFWDTTSETASAARIRNAMNIPFSFNGYGPSGYGPRLFASLVVGFEVVGDRSRAGPRLPAVGTPLTTRGGGSVCDLGDFIVAQAPFPIATIATEVATVTIIDPAPEYRWWYIRGRPRNVRDVLRIPVTYRTGSGEVDGYLFAGIADGS
jgi:hypothetical protein